MEIMKSVPFTEVSVDPQSFLGKRMETNRTATLQTCFKKCEETARFDNFAVAAGIKEGGF